MFACKMLKVRSKCLARLYIIGCPEDWGGKRRLTMRLYYWVDMGFLACG